MPLTACPSRASLSAFSLGQLQEELVAAIAEHLEYCSLCEAIATELDREADPVVASLRGLSGVMGSSAPSPKLPSRIGSYDVLSELGRGATGVVYRARHSRLHRVVALKMLLGGEFAREEIRSRFRAEAEAVARLQHPNIVQIFEFGEWRESELSAPTPYLALEYVDGGSLSSHLAGEPQPPNFAASWLMPLARAVHYAHTQGIVHRDLKPSNVLLTADHRLKLCDFGVAKLITDAGSQTLDGQLVGTPEYMAPEQADGLGRLAGPASDVYGLGAILYTMLSGRPAFHSPSVLETLEQVVSREPVPPRRLQPTIPLDLETICLKCLQKDPRRRYASAESLADDLERFLEGREILARPTSWIERAWKWARRRPAVALLSGAMAILTVLSFILITWQWQRAELEVKAQATAKLEAQRLGRKAVEGQAELALNHGLDLCERGEVGQGLLWMVQSLDLAEGAGVRWLERATRINLADWSNQLCRTRWTVQNSTPILDLAFSLDGQTLIAVGKEREARTWDTRTGVETGPPLRLGNLTAGQWINRVAFNPVDGRMALAGEEGQVSFWDLGSRNQVGHTLYNPPGRVIWGLAFSPDGRRLVTSGDDGIARWWDLATGKLVGEPLQHGDDAGYYTLALSPDGRTLITGGKDLRAVRWDVQTGRQVGKPQIYQAPVHMIKFLKDGHQVALGTRDGGFWIWDTDNDRVTELPPQGGDVSALAVSPDGGTIATGTIGGFLRMWDTATHGQAGPTYKLASQVSGLAFHADGRSLAIGQDDATLRIWDVPRPRSTGPTLRVGSSVNNLAFSPDGRKLLTCSQRGAQWWDTAEGKPLGPKMNSQRYDPGGKVVSEDGRRTYDIVDDVEATALSPDGRTLAVARWAGSEQRIKGRAELWDVATGERLRQTCEQPHPLEGVVFSPDSRQILTWNAQVKSALLWDQATLHDGRPVLQSLETPIHRAVFAPEGGTLLIACHDGTARLWDLTEDKEVGLPRRPDHGYPVTAIAFDTLGRRIVTGCQAGIVGIWDRETGTLLRDVQGNAGEVASIAFSPDGRTLLTASHDGTARFWDAESGIQLGPSLRHTDAVACAIFHPDGRTVVTGTKDGTVQRWGVPESPEQGNLSGVRSTVEAKTGMKMDREGVIHSIPNPK